MAVVIMLVLMGFLIGLIYECVLRKWTLPKETVYGYLGIDQQKYSTAHLNSYSVDSEGKTYTHIGGGDEVSLPNGYTLKLYPGNDTSCWEKDPIILHSLPGRSSILNVKFGFGWITYSKDEDEKKYFISTTAQPE